MSHFFGLWQSLININQIVKPDLIIIDGLWGQEGFGPISGTPRQMDVLIAGSNPVAGYGASRVMGLDPAQVPVCFLAYLQGLGPLEADDIEVLGPKLEEVSQPFQLPELDLSGGRNISIHNGQACRGCYAYLHFVLSKLRKNDPWQNPESCLIALWPPGSIYSWVPTRSRNRSSGYQYLYGPLPTASCGPGNAYSRLPAPY